MTRNSSGWVVRHAIFDQRDRRVTSWWCGPDRSWGHTFGPLFDDKTHTLSMSVAVFSSRQEAREAIRLVGLSGCTAVPLEQALDEFCDLGQVS